MMKDIINYFFVIDKSYILNNPAVSITNMESWAHRLTGSTIILLGF